MQAFERLDAVEGGHVVVQQDQCRLQLRNPLQGFFSIAGFADYDKVLFQFE